MGIFESIKNAIFGHSSTGAGAPGGAVPTTAAITPANNPTPTSPAGGTAPPAAAPVDINEVLTRLSAKSPQKLNWQTSIVDLMKLVGLDPSFNNRKQLSQELGYKGDPADSASMNMWLHQEVMSKLAASGGTVPASLKT